MILLSIASLGLSLPLFAKHSRFKRRYRKIHPGCAWIPLTSNAWIGACLFTIGAMQLLFYVDPQSLESFKGGFTGTFGG